MPYSEIIALVTDFHDLQWSWNPEEVDQLVARFGWTVEARRRRGMRLNTGFGMASGDIRFHRLERVGEISTRVSSSVAGETEDERAWLQDIFFQAVSAAESVLGEPTERRPGESRQVRWRAENTTIAVSWLSVVVKLSIFTNEYIDEHDEAVRLGL